MFNLGFNGNGILLTRRCHRYWPILGLVCCWFGPKHGNSWLFRGGIETNWTMGRVDEYPSEVS